MTRLPLRDRVARVLTAVAGIYLAARILAGFLAH